MTDSVKESFIIPPGYSVEEIHGELYYEDLEEDDELWLIRMPCDVELSTLDKQKLFLSSDAEDVSSKYFVTEDGKSLQCCTKNSEISDICIILPKREDGELHPVKKTVKGTIMLSESLSLNNELKIKSEKEDCSYEANSCSSIQPKDKKVINENEKSYSDLNTNVLEGKNESVELQNENANNSESKKSSKKKKHLQTDFDSSNLNYDTEAAESTYFSKSQKKLSKDLHSSRKSSERKKIKTEPISMDLDNFPTCSSQK